MAGETPGADPDTNNTPRFELGDLHQLRAQRHTTVAAAGLNEGEPIAVEVKQLRYALTARASIDQPRAS